MSKKELTGEEGVDYVVCSVCGKRFKRISTTHLKGHDITTDEYKKLYPDSQLTYNTIKENEITGGKVECLICHKYYNKLGGNHLKSHGLTKEEYLVMFPDAKMISDSAIENYALSKTGDKHPLNAPKNRDVNREILRLARIQYYIDHPEARKATGERSKQYYVDHPEARDKASNKSIEQWSDQTARDEMSKIKLEYYKNHPELIEYFSLIRKGKYTGKDNVMAREDVKLIHKQAMEEKCSGENSSSKRPEVIAKIRAARLKQIFPTKDTSIEIKVQDILMKNGYIFEKHQPCCDICQPDILFPEEKIIIQCDGDYWHNYPDGINRDHYQDKILTENGWNVIRFWEHEINDNIENCLYRFELEYYGGE